MLADGKPGFFHQGFDGEPTGEERLFQVLQLGASHQQVVGVPFRPWGRDHPYNNQGLASMMDS